jgi:hypothetical protein
VSGIPQVDLGPLPQQVPQHLDATLFQSRSERCRLIISGVQQPLVLLHEAPHLLQGAALMMALASAMVDLI